MKTNIDHRRPMQMRTSDAVIEAATALQAIARPVFTASGAIDEVYLYRGGQLRASIFKPTSGRLGIWRAGSGAARADTPEEAVRRTLDPDCNGHRGRHWRSLRKHTRDPRKSATFGEAGAP
jgi:hypothetical protein